MKHDFKNSYSSLTEVEVEGLHSKYGFADGHAYHDMPRVLQAVIEDLPSVWNHARSNSVPDIEEEFKVAAANIMRSPTLASHRHYSIAPTSSNAVDIIGAWLNEKNHNLGLIEPVFDNLFLLLKRRNVRLTSIQENDLTDIDRLDAKITDNMLSSLFIVTPNNPTGFQLTGQQFEEISHLCARKAVTLVVDTSFRLYSRHDYDTYKILHDSKVNYIVVEDTGKTWPTQDLKVGLMSYSSSIAKEVRNIYEEIFLCSSNFTLSLLTRLMDKTREAGVDLVIRQEAEKRTRYVEDILAATQLSVVRAPGACIMPVTWIDCFETGLADLSLVSKLKEHDVGLLPGRFFYWDSQDTHTNNIRLSLMRPDHVFFAGLDALKAALPQVVEYRSPLRNSDQSSGVREAPRAVHSVV